MSDFNPKENYVDEIDLNELFNILWINKIFILAVVSCFSIISIMYALSLTNIYTAHSVLTPTSADNSSGLSNQYGGLASLAGISLPGDSGEVKVAIAFMSSKKLVGQLIRTESFLPNLMAVKKWNINTKQIIFDDKLYYSKNKTWVRNYTSPYQQVPSTQEAHKKFIEIVNVSEDKKTNFVTVSVEHISPVIAQEWALMIVRETNAMVANMKIQEAQNSIDFLNEQIMITPYAELRTLLYEVIQQKTQDMMLAKVNLEYALTTIDPPLIPEVKSKPSRAFICILGALLGGMLALFAILISRYVFYKANILDLFANIDYQHLSLNKIFKKK